ncbi:MAG TPA: cytochrome P450 [Candidatus Binatus sp.]|uniref:cytochrome P450 n=1 Tax=Candidatus Binatus sp. TaxID=2811406 RepID=UPI002B472B82|nr:cytochrome P450 [Candidatus Binatus sp.]HKN12552.1 cytochrome P450 [Candidatus Binatus sp.]
MSDRLPAELLNPFDQSFRNEPYSYYPQLLDRPPVRLNRALPCVVAARYLDVTEILRDYKTFSSVVPDQLILANFDPFAGIRPMLHSDPPEHTRLRRAIGSYYDVKRSPHVRLIHAISATVERLLQKIERVSEFDAVRDLATPLQSEVVAQLLGIPSEDELPLRSWSDEIFAATRSYIEMVSALVSDARLGANGHDPFEALKPPQNAPLCDAITALRAYFSQAIARKQERSTDGLISAMVSQARDSSEENLEEMVSTCVLTLFASETAANLVSNGLLAFAQHENEYARLRSNPQLVTSAVEESLRYDSPVQAVLRYCRREANVGGTVIPAGAITLALVGAANHDPVHFTEPERFDIGRHPNDHVAFGDGIHSCLGVNIARSLGVIVVAAIAQRFKTFRLAQPGRQPQYESALLSRGLTSLRIAAE